MGAWDYGLYGNDEALNTRGVVLAKVVLPEDPRLFAGCVGLLALLEPEAHQFVDIGNHPALTALPQVLREATMVAAQVTASGPRLPYTERVRDILGIDASYGRVVDPLLALRETITIARSIRDRCTKLVDDGFAYGDTAIGGVVGVLLELRELGVATAPDLVDEWIESFDHLRDIGEDDTDFLREWSRSYRAALKLLSTEPDKKLLGSEPT
ncbi:MAG TPA: hypothetical protein VFV99_01450, partial [Kofleriaceae bacterium]|nr:hypothetical protein [Kofleriaceae bacterium]